MVFSTLNLFGKVVDIVVVTRGSLVTVVFVVLKIKRSGADMGTRNVNLAQGLVQAY